jgi:hypothetical protein
MAKIAHFQEFTKKYAKSRPEQFKKMSQMPVYQALATNEDFLNFGSKKRQNYLCA